MRVAVVALRYPLVGGTLRNVAAWHLVVGRLNAPPPPVAQRPQLALASPLVAAVRRLRVVVVVSFLPPPEPNHAKRLFVVSVAVVVGATLRAVFRGVAHRQHGFKPRRLLPLRLVAVAFRPLNGRRLEKNFGVVRVVRLGFLNVCQLVAPLRAGVPYLRKHGVAV